MLIKYSYCMPVTTVIYLNLMTLHRADDINSTIKMKKLRQSQLSQLPNLSQLPKFMSLVSGRAEIQIQMVCF